MKKINIYIFILVIFSFPVYLNSQENKSSAIKAEQYEVQRIGDNIRMTINLNLNNLHISSQQMITITPMVRSANGVISHEFAPIIITGGTRYKALERSLGFGNFEFQKEPQLLIRYNNNKHQSIPLILELLYEEWLHDAELIFIEDITGCACKVEVKGLYNNIAKILPPLFIPEYKLSYAVPLVEEIKRRSETYSARINFELNKYKILYYFKNNAQILDEIDRIIKKIRVDQSLTITEFSITGYASPEGIPHNNMLLSENRARAFVSYLKENYDITTEIIKTSWEGEDWSGLRNIVADSYIDFKEQILDILDNEVDIITRKSRLERLGGGNIYRTLLNEHYPSLRRNEYTISYIVKPFSVEEAKVIIKTNPKQLSENEIFLLANTYPKDSKDFKEIFDIAAQIYPDNPYTQLNIITLSIEKGNQNDVLISKLQQIDMPEAWNNLGIIYAEQGDYQKARELFDKAANTGLREGIWNKEQFDRYQQAMMMGQSTEYDSFN